MRCKGSLRVGSTRFRGRTYENRTEPLRGLDGEIAGCLNLGVDVTDYRETESALRQSREQLRRLTAEMHQIQENERRRIARELHDEMGQRLTALRLDLGLLRTELRNEKTRYSARSPAWSRPAVTLTAARNRRPFARAPRLWSTTRPSGATSSRANSLVLSNRARYPSSNSLTISVLTLV